MLPSFTRPSSPVPAGSPRAALLGGMLACAVFSLAGSAQAADASITVTHEGPPSDPSCPDTYTLTERVRGLRKTGLAFGSGGAAPQLAVTFVRKPDGSFQALVRASAPIEGERALSDQGKGCTSLGEAAAVTMALLLDGTHEEPAATTGSSSIVQRVPVIRRAPRPTAQLFVSGGLQTGAVAEPAARIAGEVAFQPLSSAARLTPELATGFALVPSVDADLGPGKVSTGAIYGTARAGLRFKVGPASPAALASHFAFIPSLVFSAGSIRAQGTGFSTDRAQDRAFARAGVALPVVWEAGHGISLRVVAEGDVGFRRQRFVVDAVPGAVEVPRLGGSLSIGIGAALF